MLTQSSILKRVYGYFQRKVFEHAPLIHRLSSGLDVIVRNKMEWIIYNDIFVDGDYDEAILNALQRRHSVNILDLGGNVGYFELRIAHLKKFHHSNNEIKVIAVEGSLILCDELRQRTQQLHSEINIQVHHGLAGQRTGRGTLFEFDQHGLNSIFRDKGRPENVNYLNLTQLCKDWNSIDLIKVDIEGSELAFLQHYSDLLSKTNAVVVEFHPEFCDTLACQNLLTQSGFTQQKKVRDYGNCSVHLFFKP